MTPLAEEMKEVSIPSSAGSYMGIHVIGIGNKTPRYMKQSSEISIEAAIRGMNFSVPLSSNQSPH